MPSGLRGFDPSATEFAGEAVAATAPPVESAAATTTSSEAEAVEAASAARDAT